MSGIITTVSQTTETVGGKEYPLTVTRQSGLQTIELGGELVEAELVTFFDSPLGRSVCVTRKAQPSSPEAQAANRRLVQEIAAQAMADQGLW